MSKINYLMEALHSASKKDDEEKQHRAFVYNLAYFVMYKLEIQNNRTLVVLLGKGTEYSNQQALIHWILERYSKESFSEMEHIIDDIAKDLYRFLDDELNNGDFS